MYLGILASWHHIVNRNLSFFFAILFFDSSINDTRPGKFRLEIESFMAANTELEDDFQSTEDPEYKWGDYYVDNHKFIEGGSAGGGEGSTSGDSKAAVVGTAKEREKESEGKTAVVKGGVGGGRYTLRDYTGAVDHGTTIAIRYGLHLKKKRDAKVERQEL
jgi:hypothetical protein